MSDSDMSGSDYSDDDGDGYSGNKHEFEANSEAEEVDVSKIFLCRLKLARILK